ncbi:uncharacterized protein EI90DRAFT_174437 [Cantharellus anzutake]|uniref:uncharacterized protein n=1 Tax=Cantharellus anzutake TaxID=1750568 RepID=UPI001904DEF9|nr:uncharacterized protein EI90DRAFT_174437 [Cantharellus anzutake]KAF8336429.1 hypothetical protein EI90DRAFT_174437 [Cantharellus anzutake]
MSLVIRLTEPSVFVSPPRRHEHRIPTDVTAPSIIRGLLVLKLSHTAKITSIDVSLDGISTTDWPEGGEDRPVVHCNTEVVIDYSLGIGPRRLDVVEAQAFLSIKTSLLDSIATNRRALSLGPGVSDIPDNLEEGFSLTADGTSARRGEEPMSVQSLPQGRLRTIPRFIRHIPLQPHL